MANHREIRVTAEQFQDDWDDLEDCLPQNLQEWVRHKIQLDFERWRRNPHQDCAYTPELTRWLRGNTGDRWFSEDLNHLIAGGQKLLELICDQESYSRRRGVHMEQAENALRDIGGRSRVLLNTFIQSPWVPLSYKAFLCACALEEKEDEARQGIAIDLPEGTFLNIVGASREAGLGGTVRTDGGETLHF